MLKKIITLLLISGVIGCNNGTTSPSNNTSNYSTVLTGRMSNDCAGISQWDNSTIYSTSGSLVVYENVEYKNNWWTQGNNPSISNGISGSGQPWTKIADCGVSPTASPIPTTLPSTSPSPSPIPTSSPSSYQLYPIGRGSYSGDSIVVGSDGNLYQCLSSVVAPWCNSTAEWAYAPATGLYWGEAWKLVSVTPTPTPTVSPSASPSPYPITSPTPIPTVTPSGSVLYSAYKDVGINANWNTLVMSTKVLDSTASMPTSLVDVLPSATMNTISWAFATGECGSENWGGMNASQFAIANMSSFNAKGLKYIVSTGGASGTFTCTTKSGMDTFVNRYKSSGFVGFDFDIEGGPSGDSLQSLINMIAYAQQKDPKLRISFTLATLASSDGSSLNILGDSVVKKAQAAGINFNINLMVMDYGNSSSVCVMNTAKTNCDMNLSAQQAAKNVSKRYGIPYNKIELTPMIGVNDTITNLVSLSDATNIASWAKINGIAGVHYWSFDRDASCLNTYATTTCSSSVKNIPMQTSPLQYLNAFAKGL